jgi:hypothetical protein
MSTSFPDFGSRLSPERNFTAAPFKSGFGTLLEAEHELRSAIERGIGDADDRHSTDLARILQEHHRQVETIGATLAARFERLPLPARFVALQTGTPMRTHARDARSLPDEGDSLRELARLHDELARQLGRLAEGRSGPAVEQSFSDAVLQHEEMSWMLHALINDRVGTAVEPGRRAAAAATQAPGMSESEWENEGGSPLRGERDDLAENAANPAGDRAADGVQDCARRNRRDAEGFATTSTPRITPRF